MKPIPIVAMLLIAFVATYVSGRAEGRRSVNLDVWRDSLAKAAATAQRWQDSLTRVGWRVDTLVRHVTRTVPALILHDTVSVPELVRDTAWARDYVERSQPALKDCRDLATGCALLRRTTDSTVLALRGELRIALARPEKSCTRTAAIVGALSFGAGMYVRGQ